MKIKNMYKGLKVEAKFDLLGGPSQILEGTYGVIIETDLMDEVYPAEVRFDDRIHTLWVRPDEVRKQRPE
jgi:hypothetical protein